MVKLRRKLPVSGGPSETRLWHPQVPGPLWDGSRRVALRQIEAYSDVVAREFKPEKIILFGSYAEGTATHSSDVDLLVVMRHSGTSSDQVVKIRGKAEAPFPLDLLVWKPKETKRTDSFARTVLTCGKVLYEKRNT